MSWDFAICCPHCDSDLEEDLNYTYNVSPMYFTAFAEVAKGSPFEEKGIRGLDGATGEAVVPHLKAALDYFRAHAEQLREMNPPNGWGDYGGARMVLDRLHDWALAHPQGVFRVF